MTEAVKYGAGVAWDWLKSPWWHGATTAAGMLAVAGAVATLLLWPAPLPDASQQSQEEVVKFVASEQFASLSADQQQPYFDRMRELRREGDGRRGFRDLNLSEDEQQRLRQNMRASFERRMDETIDEFFALAPEQRDAYLDTQIDDMQKRMAEWRNRRSQRRQDEPRRQPDREPQAGGSESSQGSSGSEGEQDRPRRRDGDRRRHGPTPERMKQRIEHSDPVKRARRMEYMKAMRDRMEARGIEAPWHRHSRGR
jgi:hypothetical protein